MKIEVRLSFTKETKHTYRYDAGDSGRDAVTALYVKKFALSTPPPQQIVLTIEEEA